MRNRLISYKIVSGLLIQVFIVLLASTCLAAAAAKGEKSAFWIYWNNGWRIANFGILVYFLVRWLKEPLINYLRSRKEMIAREISEAEAAEERAEQEYKEAESRLEQLGNEIQKLTDLAVSQGEAQRDKMIADAKMRAESIVDQARTAAVIMIREAKKKLREEMAETIIKIAEEGILKSMSEEDQKRLVETYIERIEKTPQDIRI